MEIERDDHYNYYDSETIKKEDISNQPSSRQYEIVELEPIRKSQEMTDSEDDERVSMKKLKQKQLFKRRVCNKLMKYSGGDKEDNFNKEKYIHIIPNFTFPPPIDDFFVFGEIILEGDFKQDPFNLDKTYSWAYFKRSNTVTYQKAIKCLEVEMKRQSNTSPNFSFMTQKYLNTPDQQIHHLGELLQDYESFSAFLLNLMQQHKQQIEDRELQVILKGLAEQYYKRCIEWMKTVVDDSAIYMYSFSEFDLNTLDNDFKLLGYSQNLLKLIGLDEESAMNVFMRKGRLEIFDGLSRLYRLMLRLMNMSKHLLDQVFILDHNLLTLDGISIPNQCEIILPNFKCVTKENFKDYDLFGEVLMNNYSGFRIFKFHINPNIIKQVFQVRDQQKKQPNTLPLDMEYSILSEVFVDRFYPDRNNQVMQNSNNSNEKKEGDTSKMCKYRPI